MRERNFSEALIETMPGLFYLIDTGGRLVKWNRNLEKTLEYPATDMAAHTLLDFFTEGDRSVVAEKIGEVFDAGKAVVEAELLSKSGKKIPCLLTGVRIVMDEEPYLLGVGLDITGRKRAEDEIKRLNDELEHKVQQRTAQLIEAREELVRREKLSILGQLAGSVGHELRNPLGVINNAVYFLKTVTSGAGEAVREYLDIIKSEVDNSERIISDLLDFSRTRTPQRVPVSVRDLIRQSLGKCVVPGSVRVMQDIPEPLPEAVIDPFQMAQVFQNLIANAVQAMPEGGELRIGAGFAGAIRRVAPEEGRGTASPSQDFMEISVTDNGAWISPENMKKLFHPLFTTKTKGIGLGLVVSKKLAEANGGRIEVESELGKGTTFTVTLPAGKDKI